MKLSELKKIIDELEESSSADYDVVLDVSPDGEGEQLVQIGDVYLSMMHENTVKIEAENSVNTGKSLKKKLMESTIVKKVTVVRCPACGKKVNAIDKHCKHCGHVLASDNATLESLKLEAKELKIRKKLVKMHERADKRAAKVAKQIEKRSAEKASKKAGKASRKKDK